MSVIRSGWTQVGSFAALLVLLNLLLLLLALLLMLVGALTGPESGVGFGIAAAGTVVALLALNALAWMVTVLIGVFALDLGINFLTNAWSGGIGAATTALAADFAANWLRLKQGWNRVAAPVWRFVSWVRSRF